MPGSKRGSASIEASLVIPLLILIIAGLIKIGTVFEKRVIDESLRCRAEGAQISEDSLTNTEDIIRGRWIIQ